MRAPSNKRSVVFCLAVILVLPIFVDGIDLDYDPVLLSLDIPLTEGYSIDWDREEIVSPDVFGDLRLTLHESGCVDIIVSFIDGRVNAQNEVMTTPLVEEKTLYSDGYKTTRLGVMDVETQIFASIFPFDNGSIYLSISTLISAVIYTGTASIHPQSISSSNRETLVSTHSISRKTIIDEVDSQTEVDREIRRSRLPVASSTRDRSDRLRFSETKIFYLAHYSTGLGNYRDGYREYQNFSVLENSHCTDFLNQADPTINEIRTQLFQTCYHTLGNNLGVYHIAFHGRFIHDDQEPEESYSQFYVNGGQLTPLNVSSIWLPPFVTPDDAIICAMSCHSFHDQSYQDEHPLLDLDTMCEAFCDVGDYLGAASYIGSVPNLSGGFDKHNPKKRTNGAIAMLLECLARSDMSVNESVEYINDCGVIINNLSYYIRDDISEPLYLENDDNNEPAFPNDWRFQKTHVIKKAAGANLGYQIHLRVHYGSGEDSGKDVYLQNGDEVPHCQVDFGDLRFQWWNQSSEAWQSLNHWSDVIVTRESHYADCWVKIDGNLSVEDQKIRVYYGDTGANAADDTSDMGSTFEIYDDFEDAIIDDDWNTSTPVGSIVENNGYLTITVASNEDGSWGSSGAENAPIIYRQVPAGDWAAIVRVENYSVNGQTHAGIMSYDDRNNAILWGRYKNSTYDNFKQNKILNDVWSTGMNHESTSLPTSLQIRNANGKRYYDYNFLPVYNTDQLNSDHIGLFAIESGSSVIQVRFSYFIIRKYIYQEPQHGMWSNEQPFMDGWAHRKSHLIIGSEGAGTDYPIRFVLHRHENDATHQDNSEHVYIGTSVKTDFSDVRFLDELSHITRMPNFLRQWRGAIWTDVDHLCAEFWVIVSDSLDDDQRVYIYYGNPQATSYNTAQDVDFKFFDDFIGTELESHWIVKEGNYDVCDGLLDIDDDTVKMFSTDRFLPGYSYHARIKFRDYCSSGFVQNTTSGNPAFDGDLATWGTRIPTPVSDGISGVDVEDDGSSNPVTVTQAQGVWQSHWINWYTADYVEAFIDGVRKTTHSTNVPDGHSSAYGDKIPIYLYTDDTICQEPDVEIDYILVRRCVYPEPQHSTWGAEVDVSSSAVAWRYRQAHTLIGNTSVGTDYQIRFRLEQGLGTSDGDTIYLNGHCKNDFSDVRFVNEEGTEVMSHWFERIQSGTSEEWGDADVWVKVSADLSYNQTIYIYYGFNKATSTSDGYATFEWFEDFEDEEINTDPDSDHWETPVDDDGGGTYVDVVSDPVESDQALKIYNNGDEVGTYVDTKSMGLASRHYAIGWKWYRNSDEYSYFMVRGTYYWVVYSYSGTSHEWFRFRDIGGTYYETFPPPSWRENQWQSWRQIEIRLSGGSSTTGVLRDEYDDSTHTFYTRTAYPGTSGYLDKFRPIYSNRYRTQVLYTDDIYVRKYTENTPGHGDWETEEVLV